MRSDSEPLRKGNGRHQTDQLGVRRAQTQARQTFFLAVGLYAPHFPNYAPQKYFHLYDVKKIKLPPYKEGDLDDLPPKIRKQKTNRKKKYHDQLKELGAIQDAISDEPQIRGQQRVWAGSM